MLDSFFYPVKVKTLSQRSFSSLTNLQFLQFQSRPHETPIYLTEIKNALWGS